MSSSANLLSQKSCTPPVRSLFLTSLCRVGVCVFTCTLPCSDGLGRSCLFVTLWVLTDQLMTEDQVDVVSAFKAVRASRPGAMDSLVRPAAEWVCGASR